MSQAYIIATGSIFHLFILLVCFLHPHSFSQGYKIRREKWKKQEKKPQNNFSNALTKLLKVFDMETLEMWKHESACLKMVACYCIRKYKKQTTKTLVAHFYWLTKIVDVHLTFKLKWLHFSAFFFSAGFSFFSKLKREKI